MIITTERFYLQILNEQHATPRYLGWLQSESANFIVNKAHQLNELEHYIQRCSEQPGCWLFGIFTKDTKQHIGNIKFEQLEQSQLIEMGILIGESAWQGKGVAKEVLLALGSYFFNQHNIKKMVLGVDKQNISAIKAYQKIGFKEELQPLSPIDYSIGILMSWDLTEHFEYDE